MAESEQKRDNVTCCQQLSCTRHDLPFCLYCVTCRVVICMECVADHPEHAMRDIQSAAEKYKPTVLNKTSELDKILQQTKESLSGLMRLHNTIQENEDLHKKEVEKAYSAALKELDAWKLSSLDDIRARYSQWSVQCSTVINNLRFQAEEVERMIQASKELLSSKDASFLQGSMDFTKAIDHQLTEKTAALEKHEVNRQKLSDSVQRDLVVPRQVTVKETTLPVTNISDPGSETVNGFCPAEKTCLLPAPKTSSVHSVISDDTSSVLDDFQNWVLNRVNLNSAQNFHPTGDCPSEASEATLKFTDTSDGRLRIMDEGAVLKAEDLSGGWWCRAVTDGRFLAGRCYWELQITCSPGCVCTLGVIQECCGLRDDIIPGSHSWFIGMAHLDDKVMCVSPSGGEIKPNYQQRRPHTGPYNVGLYLDCDQRSLTILDCNNNEMMATIRELRVTQPLVPWVQFSGGECASARLVTGDSTTLPQVLCDILNTS